MKKIISIVGTRPQFLKIGPLCKKFDIYPEFKHIIIHTGQHFDETMSKKIFDSVSIPIPDYMLNINNTTSSKMIGQMIISLEDILLKEKPHCVLVYGDCDTTLAGALVAKKLGIKLVHVESGMRSFNKTMPEETNRILTDHISDILLCATHDSINNLHKENIRDGIYYVGNLQIELLKIFLEILGLNKSIDCPNIELTKKNIMPNYDILNKNSLVPNSYVLLTIHRHYNTNKKKLKIIFNKLGQLENIIVFPIHPRTKKLIEMENITIPENIKLIDPVNFLDMIVLQYYCLFIMTDSGGIQSEAWYIGKKCFVLRSETEWTDAIKSKNNILVDIESITNINVFIKNFLQIPADKIIDDNNCSTEILNILSTI